MRSRTAATAVATAGQRVDAYVSALPDSDTTSLAGGTLYTTDLVRNGANTVNPGSGIEVLERIKIPDELVPADARVEIEAKIAAGYFTDGDVPNAELHVFPNCGHWTMIEAREAWLSAVLSFLTRDKSGA